MPILYILLVDNLYKKKKLLNNILLQLIIFEIHYVLLLKSIVQIFT